MLPNQGDRVLQWRTVDQLGGARPWSQGGHLHHQYHLHHQHHLNHQHHLHHQRQCDGNRRQKNHDCNDQDERYKLRWKNSCDMSHSWNGIVRLLPGQVFLPSSSTMFTHTGHILLSLNRPLMNIYLLFYLKWAFADRADAHSHHPHDLLHTPGQPC